MVDPVQLRPKGDIQADREALEHIARAVQGRVLRGPGSLSPQGALGLETLSLRRASIEALLEAMPAAIGILSHGDLVHGNSAFAYAFGYRSFDELAVAGGLEAIVPGGVTLFAANAHNGHRIVAVDALTRGRRRLKVSFEVKSLAGEVDLLRLIDGNTQEQELDPPAVTGAAFSGASETEPSAEDAEASAVGSIAPVLVSPGAPLVLESLPIMLLGVATPLVSSAHPTSSAAAPRAPRRPIPAGCYQGDCSSGSALANHRLAMRIAFVAAPRRRLSSTLNGANTRRPSGTRAMPCATITWLCTPTSSRSSKRIEPSRRWIVPVSAASSVDFPAPFGPSSATVSPFCTASETACSTGAAP